MSLVKKILLIVLVVYIGIVVLFESWLGYSQPQGEGMVTINTTSDEGTTSGRVVSLLKSNENLYIARNHCCLLYTSPSPRDLSTSRMPSSA